MIAALVTHDCKSDRDVAEEFHLTTHWVANIIRIIHVKLRTYGYGRQGRVKLAFVLGEHWAEIASEVDNLKALTKGTEI